MFIDTHTHLYLEEFDADRAAVVGRAVEAGVTMMMLPNIDSASLEGMFALCDEFPQHCFPMIGLHPTSVKENFHKELEILKVRLDESPSTVAVGEIGIDLYWDKTFRAQQEEAFRIQLGWAKTTDLPVAIHTRNSFDIVMEILEETAFADVTGVFHCFGGNLTQAQRAIAAGFYLGIGGVITYKNSGLQAVVEAVGPDRLLLETDAPFLPPVPHRGERNESSYIPLIGKKIAELTGYSMDKIEEITSENARVLFRINF